MNLIARNLGAHARGNEIKRWDDVARGATPPLGSCSSQKFRDEPTIFVKEQR
ncbi:MAG TPA: hypothetical protein VK195_11165 [Burkholderiaceae bacterium]|nr:hypothetical protein [Burkholderiaceae bacterium]